MYVTALGSSVQRHAPGRAEPQRQQQVGIHDLISPRQSEQTESLTSSQQAQYPGYNRWPNPIEK